MKNIHKFILDYFINEEMMEIDSQIVCESFQCNLLKELAKQLKDQKDTENKKNQEEYDKELAYYKERGWDSTPYKKSSYSKIFKQIFGGYEGNIVWHDITDKDITKIPASDWSSKKPEKQIRDVLKGNNVAIILVKDAEDKDFEFVIFKNGSMYYLKPHGSKDAGANTGYPTGRRSWHELTQREKIDLCQGKNLYFIDAKQSGNDYYKKRNEREKSRQGMLMFDPESLRRIAEDNVKRYKEILRKRRATNKNNDALLDECEKVIKRASELATEVAKNPVVNADLIGDVSTLCTWIYDDRTYSYSNYQKKYVYSGVPGILRTMIKYTKLIKDLAKNGGYEHQQNELKACEEALKNGVQKGKEIIAKIEEKL